MGCPGGQEGGSLQRGVRVGGVTPRHCESLEGSGSRLQWAEHTFGLNASWARVPALPPSWLWDTGQVSSLSEPQRPHPWNGPDHHLPSGLSGE